MDFYFLQCTTDGFLCIIAKFIVIHVFFYLLILLISLVSQTTMCLLLFLRQVDGSVFVTVALVSV